MNSSGIFRWAEESRKMMPKESSLKRISTKESIANAGKHSCKELFALRCVSYNGQNIERLQLF
jgi:hypothetical protein